MAEEGVEGADKLIEDKEAPELSANGYYYLNAFYRLNSSRSVGMGVGAIPLSEITNYCVYFEEDEPFIFIEIIQGIDSKYLSLRNKKDEKDGK